MLCSIARSLAAHHRNATWHPRCDMPYCVPIRIPWKGKATGREPPRVVLPLHSPPPTHGGLGLGRSRAKRAKCPHGPCQAPLRASLRDSVHDSSMHDPSAHPAGQVSPLRHPVRQPVDPGWRSCRAHAREHRVGWEGKAGKGPPSSCLRCTARPVKDGPKSRIMSKLRTSSPSGDTRRITTCSPKLVTTSDRKHQSAPNQHGHYVEHSTRHA